MLAPNTLLQNRYLVIRHLSRGGMGAVYLVKHQRLSKTFALKETFFSDDDQLRRAFEREAQLLANLDHPALPKVTDHFTEGESQYLVMEHIPGEDLGAQLMAQRKPFPVEQVLEWADQLLDALDYLHSNDPPIIHRDIKPPNLKLTSRGRIILLDFGLAKGETTEMSRMSRSVFGYTPNYAPLEQVQSEGTDARSDLYSLAATLYHLITGEIPPRVTTRIVAVADGQRDPLRPANELNPEVSAAVATVLTQAMARNRNQRPESAAAMREALRDASQQERISPVEQMLPPTKIIRPAQESARELQTPSKTIAPSLSELILPTERAADPRITPQPSMPLTIASPQTHVSASNLELRPLVSERGRGRSKLWIGVGAAVLVIGLVITASLGLFSSQDNVKQPENVSTASQSETARKSSTPETKTASVPRPSAIVRNQLGMELVYVPAGSFIMGSESESNEKPAHRVMIREGFYMGKYEVTQAQWQQVMGNNPSYFKNCDQCPVDQVSWDDAQEFIGKLNAMNDGYRYRLPTEAEWEYACRAGTTGDYGGDLDAMAWYTKNSDSKTHPVGQKQANSFGLYDMHGNVYEWCEDWYHESYNGAPTDGSAWLSGGEQKYRVMHGGSWIYHASGVRSASRTGGGASLRNTYLGFRVVAISRP